MNDELFERYLANTLSSADVVALKHLLASSQPARARFVACVQEWQLFAEAARQMEASQTAVPPHQDGAPRTSTRPPPQPVSHAVLSPRRHRPSARSAASARRRGPLRRLAGSLVPLGVLAACVILAVNYLRLPEARRQTIATVTVADASTRIQRGMTRVPVAGGTELQEGDLLAVPAGSWAVVRYPDDTRLEVAEKTELSFSVPERLGKQVAVTYGTLSADIAKQPAGRPMVFLTPTAAATVLGTRLELRVTSGSTRLAVERGLVGLARKADRTSIEVAAGQYAVAGTGGGPLVARSEVSAPPVSVERKRGLKGEYFGDTKLDSLLFARTDANISFDLGLDGPREDALPASFSVRWSGSVEAKYTEKYRFYTHSDSGVRLWIDEQCIIDDWMQDGPHEQIGTIALEAGHRYPIRLEYMQPKAGMLLKLSWSSPSQELEVVPSDRLTPEPAVPAAP